MLRNSPTLRQRFARLRGSTVRFDLRSFVAPLAEINQQETELETLSDGDLQARSRELIAAAREDHTVDVLLPRAFALVRETSRRLRGERQFDVQMAAGIALHHGNIVEMQTGEGKTLAAVAPAYLNALSGRGVHVLTFNDYLARRDAEWMRPIYQYLGLSVGWVVEGSTPSERRAAYGADVTYVTAKEAGFDYLRDQLVSQIADRVHRPFHMAIVDEADSLFIDEARVPLVLAGSVLREASSAPRLAALVAELEPGVHFVIEEYSRNVELLEQGFDRVEKELGCGNLLVEENYGLLSELNCALHAEVLLQRDVDYLVRAGKIELVDEFTGRVAENRHWPDGLQAALEAKEGLARRSDGRILGSISLQYFLTGYQRLSGMTGTARDAAREFHDFYGLEVVVIPTHRPMIRVDHPDVVFTHAEAKDQALVQEIRRVHDAGRPVLVGTLTVVESERLASRLQQAGVACQILNAKNDQMEAELIARAGREGAVTISTNMAGRGTDIRLGGDDVDSHQRVVALGGLYVIGTNRNESLRIDRQLRGRAGRQGDPGESRFFVSLEDDLMVRYGIRDLIPPALLPAAQTEPVENPVLRREIARAQRIIEGQNFEIRKTLSRYSEPVEDQRQLLVAEREQLLLQREPEIWSDTPRISELIAAAGKERVREAETLVTLFHMDQAWSDHLAWIAGFREGIHLVGLGGNDPLTEFRMKTAAAFHAMRDELDSLVRAAVDKVEIRGHELSLDSLGIKGPSSTWTYLINDDPFRNQLGRTLTGPGASTMAVGAALVSGPLFLLWLLVERWRRRGSARKD